MTKACVPDKADPSLWFAHRCAWAIYQPGGSRQDMRRRLQAAGKRYVLHPLHVGPVNDTGLADFNQCPQAGCTAYPSRCELLDAMRLLLRLGPGNFPVSERRACSQLYMSLPRTDVHFCSSDQPISAGKTPRARWAPGKLVRLNEGLPANVL